MMGPKLSGKYSLTHTHDAKPPSRPRFPTNRNPFTKVLSIPFQDHNQYKNVETHSEFAVLIVTTLYETTGRGTDTSPSSQTQISIVVR